MTLIKLYHSLQANPKEYPNFMTGFRRIYGGAGVVEGHGKGVAGIFKGWFPTLVGYSAQGIIKIVISCLLILILYKIRSRYRNHFNHLINYQHNLHYHNNENDKE